MMKCAACSHEMVNKRGVIDLRIPRFPQERMSEGIVRFRRIKGVCSGGG